MTPKKKVRKTPVIRTKRTKKGFSITAIYRIPETPYGVIRKTRKSRVKEISEFHGYLTDFYALNLCSGTTLPLIIGAEALKDLKVKLSKTTLLDYFSVSNYNQIMIPTVVLCINEFNAFINELQCGSYNGAARTLRCILETAIEACEFQTEPQRPTCKTLMEEYLSQYKDKLKKKKKSFFIKNNAWAAFSERVKTYEKSKRIAPTFRELVNNLNSRQLFNEAPPQAFDELKQLFEILSDYVHPSSVKFEKAIEKKTPMLPSLSLDDFDKTYELGKKTLDLTLYVYAKTMAHFFDFKTGKDLLQVLASHIVVTKKTTPPLFSLPHSSLMSSGIKWSIKQK